MGHQWPVPYIRRPTWQVWASRAFLLLAITVWSFVLAPDAETKVLAFLSAAAYAGIEFSWYVVSETKPDGSVHFAPAKASLDKGFTTAAQFWANVLYTPVLIGVYRAWLPSAGLRIALFPLNVWLLEIVVGSVLTRLFNTRAWYYRGPDAFVDGHIKLGYVHLWWLLGAAVELSHDRLLRPLARAGACGLARPAARLLTRDAPAPGVWTAAVLGVAATAMLLLLALADDGSRRRHTRLTPDEIESFRRCGHSEVTRVSAASGKLLFSRRWFRHRESAATCRGVIVAATGYTGHSGSMARFAARLAQAGFIVSVQDHEGHGRSAGRHGYVSAWDHVVADVVQHAREMAAEFPGCPVFLLGASLGGLACTQAAATLGHGLAGLVLLSPLAVPHPDSMPSAAVRGAAHVLDLFAPFLPIANAARGHAAHDPSLEAELRARDPLLYTGRMRVRTGLQVKRGMERGAAARPRVRCPTIVLHGTDDHVCDAVSSRVAFDALGAEDKEFVPVMGGSHLLLREASTSETVQTAYLAWLKARAPRRDGGRAPLDATSP